MAPLLTLFGPIDTVLGGSITFVVMALAVLNVVTRARAHRRTVAQAEDGADAMSRSRVHQLSNALLVLASFYYLTLEPHGGTVLSVLVVGLVLTDVFEFEARQVEVRRGTDIERPKGAIGASVFVLLYAGYQSVFFLVEPVWSAIV